MAITIDIDDTRDRVYGHQQLSLFHARYDTLCFLPIHIHHVESGKPMADALYTGQGAIRCRGPYPHRVLVRHICWHYLCTRLADEERLEKPSSAKRQIVVLMGVAKQLYPHRQPAVRE